MANVGTPLPIIAWIAVAFGAYSLDHRKLDVRRHERGVALQFTRPGKPVENACIESPSVRLHGEYLGLRWRWSLAGPRRKIEQRQVNYHFATLPIGLACRTPVEFIRGLQSQIASMPDRLLAKR